MLANIKLVPVVTGIISPDIVTILSYLQTNPLELADAPAVFTVKLALTGISLSFN